MSQKQKTCQKCNKPNPGTGSLCIECRKIDNEKYQQFFLKSPTLFITGCSGECRKNLPDGVLDKLLEEKK